MGYIINQVCSDLIIYRSKNLYLPFQKLAAMNMETMKNLKIAFLKNDDIGPSISFR